MPISWSWPRTFRSSRCIAEAGAAPRLHGLGTGTSGSFLAYLEVHILDPFAVSLFHLPLLPGGTTLTGMVSQTVSENARSALLDPSITVPPLLWLVSPEADGMTGCRLVATSWQPGSEGRSAAEAATEQAGC